MIKVENGKCSLKGNINEILAELSFFIVVLSKATNIEESYILDKIQFAINNCPSAKEFKDKYQIQTRSKNDIRRN